jgi:mono/diheme cytochrome c family protein
MSKSVKLIPIISLCGVLEAILLAPVGAFAQGARNGPPHSDQELTGMRLFSQHCRVCHARPLLVTTQYGPVLSRETLGGNVEAMRLYISNGTSRMPGFQYTFTPAEIDAIAAYLLTMPSP